MYENLDISYDCALWQDHFMDLPDYDHFQNVTFVMEQVIWRCDLSIWPTFQKP
jgi:hypothetical protein